MNRSHYFNFIEEKLNVLAYRITAKGKLNLLDLHVHSEDFYLSLLNLLFGWQLENLNAFKQNVEGIDLIDNLNKVIVQVSATSTKQKIEGSLSKKIFGKYSTYTFKFISIAKDASDLRVKIFKNPYGIQFTPNDDILDINVILRRVSSLVIDDQKKLYEFIKKELGRELDIVKLDSNLASIINILSKENLVNIDNDNQANSFEIENKIIFNELNASRMVIEDYKIHYGKLDKKYSEFDKLGANKSYAVLQAIRKQYIKICSEPTVGSSDRIFFMIIEEVKDLINNSKNYVEIPIEELDVCVNIIVVDAFIRCKIFKNPEGYEYAITR
ncbi:ABC-three component system protein [Paenibacillus sp. 2RAB27]|uniref:ABC-three component system protein n=1 Tax=Paenibacillus sp. 2RAB27 TaxID=3232991 RepID=UPI003F95562B